MNTITVLDPEIPFLAAKAAIELDNALLGRPTDFSAVQEISKRLPNPETTGNQQSCMFLDSPTVSAVKEAVGWSSHEEKTVNDLVVEAFEIATQHLGTGEQSERDLLEKARFFYATLSERATACQRSLHDAGLEYELQR